MKAKRCFDYVTRPGAIVRLPDYTKLAETEDGDGVMIIPDTWAARLDCPNVDNVPAGYRGLAVSVSDHGNISLLRVFANGHTREIWGAV